MGYLARGTWIDEWYDTASSGGRFVRQDSRFRSLVRQGGDYPPEPGRYHLYVSWACPWASRTMIYRALKNLKDAISVTVVDPLMLSHGWVIASGADPINRAEFLWQVQWRLSRRLRYARNTDIILSAFATVIRTGPSSPSARPSALKRVQPERR
jgi:glutathionyl-hydroquinone reductase